MTTKLGQLLVAEGLLSEGDRKTIQEASGNSAGAFARGILALGLLNEEELAAFLADRTHYRVAAKDIFSEIDDRALGAIDTPLLRQLEVLPLRLDSNILAVAMIDPLDRATLHQLEFFTGYKIKPLIATLRQVRQGLSRLIPGYKPEPSAFEAFMATHLSALKTSRSRQDRAKELVAQLVQPVSRHAPISAPEEAEATIPPVESPEANAPEVESSPETGVAATAEAAPNPATEPAVGDLAAETTADAGPAVEEAPATPPTAQPFAPKFTGAPAIAANEAAANKALLELNKKLMDMTVAENSAAALSLLVGSLFGAGIDAGCVAVRRENGAIEGALWSGPESVAVAALGELRGDMTPSLMEAITNYAPEVMESDGWLQIPADDDAGVKASLDLIEPGEPRTAIETALRTSESVLLARAIKLPGGAGDLVTVLVWPNASAGHEALRASVSNAMRACSQKLAG
ncbi:MAG: hypothetical protein RIQ81_1485 [Pseudomonadota bacterium]|jgi:hypothetical protein